MSAATHAAAPQPWPTPLTWLQPLPSACNVCSHGRGPRDARSCTCPQVATRGAAAPCGHARSHAGACGPDARFLTFEE